MEIGSYKNPLEFTLAYTETRERWHFQGRWHFLPRQHRQMDQTSTSGVGEKLSEGREGGEEKAEEEGGRKRQ